jgi:hypothetical protein
MTSGSSSRSGDGGLDDDKGAEGAKAAIEKDEKSN